MSNLWRKLDNTAKIFTLDRKDNINTFRLSVILKESIDPILLKKATIKSMQVYPSYKVKIKSGFFWNYLEINLKDPIIEEEHEIPCKNINLKKNNGYLFKVTYFNNKINLDVFHALTDGHGATILFKSIIYNYLDLKYHLKTDNLNIENIKLNNQDEYLKNYVKTNKIKEVKKAYQIKEKSNPLSNKTYHYILNLKKIKNICKMHKATITEYLTAMYLYAIYKTVYNKQSKRDISIAIPIDLRKHYQVESFSNFFTCMNIEGNLHNNKNLSFGKILEQVKTEFKNKLTKENVKKYLARDVSLGSNLAIRLVPLCIKKQFIKLFSKTINQKTTTTLSNIGIFSVKDKYKKYIDNIMVLVNAGKIQKVKCTICSYENNLTVTINSNIINNKLEKEFYKLLKKHIGDFKLESNLT